MPILEFKSVSKEYTPGVKALDNINVAIRKGEFISVIGKSGAGKSTFMRCINRLIDPTSGQVLFEGENVLDYNKKELRNYRSNVGMIFQHYNLVERLSVIKNVCHGRLGYISGLRGVFGKFTKEEENRAMEILEELDLADQAYKRADQLSGGQKQRVGIARALIQDPKLILCDEPIASLDPSSSKLIMDHLHKINKETGITVIANLHQVDVAQEYSDRIIGMAKGKVVFDGLPQDLTEEVIYDIYGSDAHELGLNLVG